MDTNVTVGGGNAIIIATNGVTLYLDSFNISSTEAIPYATLAMEVFTYMKTIGAMLLCAICACGQESKDVRYVSGKAVDVGPVGDWLKNPSGERPMKHWKVMQIIELRGPSTGGTRCVVRAESGQQGEILLMNVPPAAVAVFQTVRKQSEAIASLRSFIDREERAIQDIRDGEYAALQTDTATVIANSRTGVSVDSTDERRAAFSRRVTALRDSKEQLRKLEAEMEEILTAKQAATAALAMFTGKTYAKLEIWDCGQKQP